MMKKLIQSAFALSLIFCQLAAFAQTEAVDDILGLENEVLPELKGPQGFTPTDMNEKQEWNVKENDAMVDKEPLKGQRHSIIPWKGIDPEKFLDINTWLTERAYKDQVKDWQIRLRDARHNELVGKVLKCTGTCPLYRGSVPINVQHLSRIHEGDEVHTEKGSTLWIYLMDGTLVRLGSKSSLSFHEINFAPGEVLHVARLNNGHVYWHPRIKGELAPEFSPETDVDGLPLLIREANLEFYERQRFARQTDQEHLAEIMDLEEGAVREQFAALNRLKKQNNPALKLKNKVMLVAPNATVLAADVSFDLLHISGGKTYLKKRAGEEDHQFEVLLRGYTNTEASSPEAVWNEVSPDGRTLATVSDVPGELQVSELLTKRIKTLEVAREIWLGKFTLPILQTLNDPKKLAVEQGYNLWGEELQKRIAFLKEYTRRIETTNLRSKENLMAKLEAAGEKQDVSLSSAHYQASLNRYLKSLKQRYNDKKMQVREMNDLQYYVWILKNGKF